MARESVSPLTRLETALHPWVGFFIMPIFALANAGVVILASVVGHPVAVAVAVGLVVGKPFGIVLFSWLAIGLGVAHLPSGVNWRIMIGAGALAGIGFTMSLFIAGLALPGDMLDAGKIGTLTARWPAQRLDRFCYGGTCRQTMGGSLDQQQGCGLCGGDSAELRWQVAAWRSLLLPQVRFSVPYGITRSFQPHHRLSMDRRKSFR
jgi:hypothetical protein